MNLEDSWPLCWPPGVPRTKPDSRRRALFRSQGSYMTVERAVRRLREELRLFTPIGTPWRVELERVVVSTNMKVRKGDGLPSANQPAPADPGVAVYFSLDGDRRCIPCDRWTTVADNVAGIAAAIGALRGLERYVNDAHVRAAFTGFAALPDPNRIDWRAILGFRNGDGTREAILQKYRELARDRHPDRGGSDAAMSELNRARDQALAELER